MSQFVSTVSQLNRRGTLGELDAALESAVQQVRRTGKPAEIIYKLKIKPTSADGDEVQVSDGITVKTAEPARRAATFFTTEEGGISRENPNQSELPLRALDGGKASQEEQQEKPKVASAS